MFLSVQANTLNTQFAVVNEHVYEYAHNYMQSNNLLTELLQMWYANEHAVATMSTICEHQIFQGKLLFSELSLQVYPDL